MLKETPLALSKAIKNKVEVEGMRKANVRANCFYDYEKCGMKNM